VPAWLEEEPKGKTSMLEKSGVEAGRDKVEIGVASQG
jgi:hypothetical protein